MADTDPWSGFLCPVPEPTVHATRYTVSCLGEKHFHFALSVEYRGEGKWAVMDGPFGLFADGRRDWESTVGDRFDLETALRLAREQAPLMTVNGRTVADVLAMEVAS